jgi:hypothetical protein
MAILRIEAAPSAGLEQYSFTIHGSDVPFAENAGEVSIFWMRCGSREMHFAKSILAGPAGEKLAFTVFCDGNELGRFENIKRADTPEQFTDYFRI